MMNRANLKLVSSQPAEALLAHRLSEVQDAWATLLWVPFMPQSWFALFSATDRLEGERARIVRDRR